MTTARRSSPARRTLVVVLAAGSTLTLGGCMGLFAGTRPTRLGVADGALQPVRAQLTNAVSSTATTDYHRIAPLDAGSDPARAMTRVRAAVVAMPGATVVEERPGYLYAEFASRTMGFVDDVEFLLDDRARVIHVRSASRLGRKDFGVNRARIEAIRARLGS